VQKKFRYQVYVENAEFNVPSERYCRAVQFAGSHFAKKEPVYAKDN